MYLEDWSFFKTCGIPYSKTQFLPAMAEILHRITFSIDHVGMFLEDIPMKRTLFLVTQQEIFVLILYFLYFIVFCFYFSDLRLFSARVQPIYRFRSAKGIDCKIICAVNDNRLVRKFEDGGGRELPASCGQFNHRT